MTLPPANRLTWLAFRVGWSNWKALDDCVELTAVSTVAKTEITYQTPPHPVANEETKVDEATVTEFMDSPLAPEKTIPLHDLTVTKNQKALKPEVEPEIEPVLDPETVDAEFEDELEQVKNRAKFDANSLSSRSKEEAMDYMRKFRRYGLKLRIEIISPSQRFVSYTNDISLGGIALVDPIPNWVAGYCTVILSTEDSKHQLEFMCSVVENQAGERFRLEIYPSSDSGELKKWLEEGIPGSEAS